MLRFLKFFFIISIIFNNTGVAKSENLSLAYVDVDMIINNSNAGKKFFNEINQSIQKKKFNNQINNKRLIGSKDLLKSLHKILTDYASDNQLSLILQKKNIIIGKTNLDITKSIMEIFNKKVKKVNLS